MRIAIASDHAGFALKEALKERLQLEGYDVEDFGALTDERTDYPDFAKRAAAAVHAGQADRGILICGTGIGMAMAANRYPRVRAAVLNDAYDAEMSRRHNDATVACLGARKLSFDSAITFVEIFLTTPFDGGRHAERVEKLGALPDEV